MIKQRQQAMWAAGDYSAVATYLYPTAEVLCEEVGINPGARVLDVATGSGNVAIAAARRHAHVVGIDYVPALLERGRERAQAERLAIDFQEADAEALPFPDGSFDIVLSAFGVMFAPNQEQAARELVRVCRPGGRIGLACWPPFGGSAELFTVSSRYVPPPPGLKPPVLWGTATRLNELFGDRARSIRMLDRTYLLKFESPEIFVERFRAQFGPVLKAFEQLDAAQHQAYAGELADIMRRYNRAMDGTVSAGFNYVVALIQL
jgi:SAM-dependent methyltransferase